MNEKKRNKLRSAVTMLSNAMTVVDNVHDDESDCVESCPENLQNSERYESMVNAVDVLEEAMGSIDEAIDQLKEAISM